MMRIHRGLTWMGVACLALLWAAPTLRAQSLGEIAEREKERRARDAQAGKSGRVISDDELKKHSAKGAQRSTSGDEAGTASETTTTTSTSGSSESKPAEDEDASKSFWRGRLEAARKTLEDAEQRARDLETPAREARGKPNAEGYEDALRESEQRRARIDEYESAQREADAARKALNDLESEARAAGGL